MPPINDCKQALPFAGIDGMSNPFNAPYDSLNVRFLRMTDGTTNPVDELSHPIVKLQKAPNGEC